jgi:Skp family chaperone for outer membrane proteins
MTARSARLFAVLFAGVAAGLAARPWATTRAAGEKPADGPPLRAGHVCMAEFMSKSRKWVAEAAVMSKLREEKGESVVGLKTAYDQKAARAAEATGEARTGLEQEAAVVLTKFQAAEKKARAEIDGRSLAILTAIHRQFRAVITEVARERNLEAVYAYPAPVPPPTGPAEPFETHAAMDFYFRPPAMTPVYLRGSVDLTSEVLRRMDALYDAELRRPAR